MLALYNDRKRLRRPEAGSRHDRQNCLGIACKLGWERQDQRIAAVGRWLHELSISGRPSYVVRALGIRPGTRPQPFATSPTVSLPGPPRALGHHASVGPKATQNRSLETGTTKRGCGGCCSPCPG